MENRGALGEATDVSETVTPPGTTQKARPIYPNCLAL